MDTAKIRLIFLVVKFWIKAVTMAISHLTTDRYIPYFGLNFNIFTFLR